ncbi:reticulon-4-interacting protein 1 homolog, mitochondrial-like [Colias croceus]|uniref:reticulon-4-interacting protein 1 homolog, mitochondrial-like n=1 Tax=Colias crocea TaxID=72248 RepID=UPI001E2808FB|nr:reticulon-4-interacting protein 1 homolog, mitochondrial-like [Colias croceus]XP_045496038.1 reticulon-4-interacting protein 1 homolog, mitochondrial-like [Colias croceus]XP_045496039.1 reticulon-4-interacting protein 1 homolog, mitochondrial-like [Colias croceus]XP_045496040.1 reticulon-4-interacting protein 1 homolog, mitochondrial-like [Colias croceus]XP_045496041.1 reticulon-4-interacting protein 1 homolog, mitochondrial-like [Colias croceus]
MLESQVKSVASRMRAWRVHSYGGLAELQLDSARVPALRSTDDVLVKVHAASLNPLDVAMLGGYGSRVLNVLRRAESAAGAAELSELPLVPGRDFCGRVERAGPAARLRPGARVWGVLPPHRPGALADYVLVKDRWAGRAPQSLDEWQAGGALYAALTACSALRAAGVRVGAQGAGGRGTRVLLLGLGGVGQAALQLLVHSGAHVAVGCAAELAPLADALGAAATLDRHAPDYDRQLDDAGPYDVILDCCGAGGWEAGARRWRFARYVTLSTPLLALTDARGLAAGAACALAALAGQALAAARSPPAAPALTAPCPPHVRWAYFVPRADDIEMLRRLAERGKFKVQVEQVYGWWDAARALQRVQRGHARGKLVLDFTAPAPTAPPADTIAPT